MDDNIYVVNQFTSPQLPYKQPNMNFEIHIEFQSFFKFIFEIQAHLKSNFLPLSPNLL